jgi:hypothetical protein
MQSVRAYAPYQALTPRERSDLGFDCSASFGRLHFHLGQLAEARPM